MKEYVITITEQIGRVIYGKDREVRLALACLFAGGHLLIEDIPGIGKTTLVRAMALSLGLGFDRVQFTSDLLPGDILGVSVYDQTSGTFFFHAGPIFTHVLLADEINRTPPKTQSALLEAMEEGQVSVEGQTRILEKPFMVIATKNPVEQAGTFPLPDSQLDRFMMRIHLGYPRRSYEKKLLSGGDTKEILDRLKPVLSPDGILEIQGHVKNVSASDALLEYVLNILEYTRSSDKIHLGLSPRSGLSLLQAARAWAYMDDRDYLLPEDIQEVLPYVVGHRLRSAKDIRELEDQALTRLIKAVPVL